MEWHRIAWNRGLASEKCRLRVARIRRVLTACNTASMRFGAARRIPHVFAIFTLLLSALHAGAQSVPPPDGTMTAYRTLEGWVRAWSVPEQTQQIDPPECHGSQVTLRLAGKVIGRGSLVGDDGTTLWHATRAAWREAEGELGVEKDALRAERTLEAAHRVTIDVEIAGPMTPLLGATWADASERISPGIEGVAGRVGDDVQAFFPGDMIASGTLPGRALQICAGRLRLPPLELGQLREKQGLEAYRFHSLHLTQLKAGGEPTFLTRGGRLVPESETSGPGLRQFADRLAKHLMTHEWPGAEPHGLMGSYLPLTDAYDPLLGSPREQGIVALALARYATTPGVDRAIAFEAAAFAVRIVDQLSVVTKDEPDPLASPIDAAAWIIADCGVRAADAARAKLPASEFGLRATSTLMALWHDPKAWAGTSAAARAFIVYAMACAGVGSPEDSELKSAALEGVRGLFRDTDSAELVSLMPWLGWAELALASGSPSVASADALRDMRSRLWQSQLTSVDVGAAERDLEGGIVFTRGTTPLPTWQALRPLAFAASMIGDARLTSPQELTAEIASLRRSLRFVRQLCIDEASAWAARNPERAIGGVRPALWTPTLSLDASALALLSVSQTLTSISERAGVQVPPKGPMGRPQPELPTGISR